MSFKKPFRAVPIREGKFHRATRLRKERSTAVRLIVKAALAGAVVGAASIGMTANGKAAVMGWVKVWNNPV